MELRSTIWAPLLAIACTLAVATGAVAAQDRSAQTGPAQTEPSRSDAAEPATLSQARLDYGAYLALAGNCLGCHTRSGGEPFAGGLALDTPYGTIYTPNITAANGAGIGAFSDSDFLRAMHDGVAPDGTPYYPAFPYASFSKVSDDDLLAIKDYLFSLPPSDDRPPKTRLRWPFDARDQIYGWQELYLTPGRFQPSVDKSDEWNRGAYLIQGLGHCGACHAVGSPSATTNQAAAVSGALLRGWAAPNPASGIGAGLGDRSVDELAEYLRTGIAKRAPEAAALTTELVHANLSRLASSDLRAMAVYLKDQPPAPAAEISAASAQGLDARVLAEGRMLYTHYCSACHQRYGQGFEPYFPSLRGNPVVTAPEPGDALKGILLGAPADSSDAYSAHVVMPSFGSVLNDQQIAVIASYIRASWGNQAPAVSAEQVAEVRSGGR